MEDRRKPLRKTLNISQRQLEPIENQAIDELAAQLWSRSQSPCHDERDHHLDIGHIARLAPFPVEIIVSALEFHPAEGIGHIRGVLRQAQNDEGADAAQ